MASIFTQAYSRGVASKLIEAGHAKFASAEAAEQVADFAGAQWDVDPTTTQVTADKLAALVNLILEKAAEGTGTLVGQGQTTQNTPVEAAKHNPLAALDQKLRPQGMYAQGEKGVGNTAMKAPAAAIVGVEQAHPLAPGVTDHKANSVNTFAKAASLTEMLRKIAEGTGSLVTGDKAEQANTPAEAAKDSPTAALDEKERPQGTYAKGEQGVGKTDLDTKPGVVGKEEPHDKAPGVTDSKPNSIVEQSKTSAYIARFEETAQEYLPHLPASLSEDEKVASIKLLMGFSPEEAQSFLVRTAAEKAASLEELLKEKGKDEEKAEGKAEKKDEQAETKSEDVAKAELKKEEKEEKKEASLYSYRQYDASASKSQSVKNTKTAQLSGLAGFFRR